MLHISKCYVRYVAKRDGTVEAFDAEKLEHSIHRVLLHLGKRDRALSLAITNNVCEKLGNPQTVDTEKIRKVVLAEFKKRKLSKASQYYEFVFLKMKSKIKGVKKRDGTTQPFNPHKVFKSLCRAARDAGIHDPKMCETLTKEVSARLEKKFSGKPVPVESIKKETEEVLKKRGLPEAARRYTMERYL